MKPPASPPDHDELLSRLIQDRSKRDVLWNVAHSAPGAAYEHWDKVRFRKPFPPLTPAEMWAAIKFGRRSGRTTLPLIDKTGRAFHFVLIPDFLRALHEIDSNARGLIGMPGKAASAEGRDIYLQKSLVEEPFSSSALEGAATTREIAKKLIEEGRKPKTLDEKMVLNNYLAMSFIREHRDEALTPATILELHRILTVDTLERPEKVGVLRTPEDDVRVVESVTGETLHTPPPAKDLAKRLEALCAFANAPSTGKGDFLPPVIRAIVLHFMLAYDHPFWDGNGRCARALFYWCVLRHSYWLLEYVSISSVIRRAPTKYGMAFLYSETDEGDLTYFIEHQLDVVGTALADLQKYLLAKSRELHKLGQALGALEQRLNRRQLPIIQDALKRDAARYTIAEHAKLHSVSYLTARADLESLVNLDLLKKTKEGVLSVYLVPRDLKERLERLGKG
jgi:Fic family protein